ncbi:MAG: hypothetical protein JST00_46480 [Deltaproteobacteria bacterium]|nr:hypothetical protein [Deltaproteobacteria bacterium]
MVVTLVASLTAAPAFAQGDLKRIGGTVVNGALDKDTLTVAADAGAFTAIELRIEASKLDMKEVKITFSDNATFTPPTKPSYNAGEVARFDLPSAPRVIQKIDFTYGNVAGGANARVEVYGKPAATPPPPPPPPASWKKLGERTVNGKFDKDTIHVGADDGLFTAIQIKVENSELEMFDVKVVFGDGSSFSPPTRLKFGPNDRTRVIDLPGDKRVIKRVEFKYGNVGGDKKNARVELWGRR